MTDIDEDMIIFLYLFVFLSVACLIQYTTYIIYYSSKDRGLAHWKARKACVFFFFGSL